VGGDAAAFVNKVCPRSDTYSYWVDFKALAAEENSATE